MRGYIGKILKNGEEESFKVIDFTADEVNGTTEVFVRAVSHDRAVWLWWDTFEGDFRLCDADGEVVPTDRGGFSIRDTERG